MKRLHPITSGILQAITVGFLITLLFIFSLGLLAAYGQPFLDWMDENNRGAIVLLGVGCVAYVSLFFYGVITKR